MVGEVLSVDVTLAGGVGAPSRLEARFEVPAGVTVLFGASGAGKTTCLSLIAGLVRPDRGRIVLGDQVLTDVSSRKHVPAHQRRVAFVFQSLALFPHMSALDNVAYGLPRRTPRAARPGEARRWLERMRVAHVAERRPPTLSGGESQRVALARALASSPRALLLDEPFSAMDEALRAELGSELASIVADLGLPTVLVTHDRADALALGAHVVVLSAGRVVASGALDILRHG